MKRIFSPAVMKFHISFFLLVFALLSSKAQEKKKEFSHYVLPEFRPGTVLMKNGQKNRVSLNYNSLSEEIIFENKGHKMAIADDQLEQVDTVFVDSRKFVRQEDTFLELISSKPKLYAEHKCRIKYPGRVNGPGGQTSQTSSTETYNPTDFRRIIYEVVLPTGYDTSPYRYYWIEKDSELHQIKSLKQLVKLYPLKKGRYKNYKSEHEIDYHNSDDILSLLRFLESN